MKWVRVTRLYYLYTRRRQQTPIHKSSRRPVSVKYTHTHTHKLTQGCYTSKFDKLINIILLNHYYSSGRRYVRGRHVRPSQPNTLYVCVSTTLIPLIFHFWQIMYIKHPPTIFEHWLDDNNNNNNAKLFKGEKSVWTISIIIFGILYVMFETFITI